MRRSSITVLFVLLICVVALGFYRGWFTLSSHNPDAGNNQVNVNLKLDGGKIQEDAEAVKNKATELAGRATEGATEPSNPATDNK